MEKEYQCKFRGYLLKKIRVTRGYTQYELSQKTGIFQSTISRWEQDLNEPRVTEIAKVAKELKCFIEDFLE